VAPGYECHNRSMMKWLRDGSDSTEAASPTLDLARLAQLDTAVVFKHSASCPVSWMAERQMRMFQTENPEVPFYKVIVQEERGLSNELERWTGVEHESPQILVFKKGKVTASLSQGDVTAPAVEEAVKSV
jgi:bacillithiol system protein YtxJ